MTGLALTPGAASWLYLGAVLFLFLIWFVAVARTRYAVAMRSDDQVSWVWEQLPDELRDRLEFDELGEISEPMVEVLMAESDADLSDDTLAEAMARQAHKQVIATQQPLSADDLYAIALLHLDYFERTGI